MYPFTDTTKLHLLSLVWQPKPATAVRGIQSEFADCNIKDCEQSIYFWREKVILSKSLAASDGLLVADNYKFFSKY